VCTKLDDQLEIILQLQAIRDLKHPPRLLLPPGEYKALDTAAIPNGKESYR